MKKAILTAAALIAISTTAQAKEINLECAYTGVDGTQKSKEIVKDIKSMKIKVQAQIQEDKIRVVGKKRDDLQSVINMIKEKDYGIHIEFGNYR